MGNIALVTGGAGFIGSHVIEVLLRYGWRVRILDNFRTGSRANLHTLSSDVEIIEGDIRCLSTCQIACRGIDSVFHLAALASVASSVADPLESHAVNVAGTLNLLVASRDAGARRFIFSSSASVYGNAHIVPTDELQPLQPQSPYASDKASCELYGSNFRTLYGLEFVTLRYFNVFGPRQNLNSGYAAVIPSFIQAALEDRDPCLYGDGKQTRDFVFVEDIARANLLAATASGIGGRTFNVAGGKAISLLDLLAALEVAAGKSVKARFEAGRTGEVRHSRAEVSAAQRDLGFVPQITLAEGMRRTLEAYRQEFAGKSVSVPAETAFSVQSTIPVQSAAPVQSTASALPAQYTTAQFPGVV